MSVQSMTNTLTRDAEATLIQIQSLYNAGCQIVRVSVPDKESAEALKTITASSPIPVVADIHFDYKLAIASVEAGAAKIRINPGNIGGENKVRELAAILKERNIPIRIGVNAGSLEREIEDEFGRGGKALAESALNHVRLLEACNFYDIIISVKSSSVTDTIEAYELLDKLCDYPLHLGVTEAGAGDAALIKSAMGIGILLERGIGDTIRVSLAGDPVKEVITARRILQNLNMGGDIPEIIACPTCARTNIDVEGIAKRMEELLIPIRRHIKVAVMGCIVNGPGEAKDADMGIAGGKEKSAFFQHGKIVETISNNDIEKVMEQRIKELINGEIPFKTE